VLKVICVSKGTCSKTTERAIRECNPVAAMALFIARNIDVEPALMPKRRMDRCMSGTVERKFQRGELYRGISQFAVK
jgi:hypothetical protein